jgi:hypothetical protein
VEGGKGEAIPIVKNYFLRNLKDPILETKLKKRGVFTPL